MSGLRGVRSTEGRQSRWVALARAVLGAALAAVLGGCKGDRIVIGRQSPPTVSELVDTDAGDGRDAGTSEPGIGTPARCPESPGERRQVLGCWPTRQVGRWQGFWLGLPRYETPDAGTADFPPGDVVMRLGGDGSGTFSVGTSSAAGPVTCGPGADAGACPSLGELVAGFEYRLARIRLQEAGERGTPRIIGEALPRAGELMEFDVRLGEPWAGWCSGESPTECQGAAFPAAQTEAKSSLGQDLALGTGRVRCLWSADGCVPEAPTLALALTLSENGQALRGTYRPRDARLPPVHLELLRVGDP